VCLGVLGRPRCAWEPCLAAKSQTPQVRSGNTAKGTSTRCEAPKQPGALQATTLRTIADGPGESTMSSVSLARRPGHAAPHSAAHAAVSARSRDCLRLSS
jgi:hypothetical protein